MTALLVRRLIALVPLMLGISVILFILTHLLPADPVRAALGSDASPEQVQAYRDELRLDDPLFTQYVRYVANLAQGDFGISIISRRPVLGPPMNGLASSARAGASATLTLSASFHSPRAMPTCTSTSGCSFGKDSIAECVISRGHPPV